MKQKIEKLLVNKLFVTLVIALLTVGCIAVVGVKTLAVQGDYSTSDSTIKSTPIDETSIDMIIVGQNQGVILGEGPDNAIVVKELTHEVNAPYDNNTGQPFGNRRHNPIIITKLIDKSSPSIWRAMGQNEPLTVTIKWYRINPADSRRGWQQYYTITLENAKIVTMKEYDKSSPMLYSEGGDLPSIMKQYDTATPFIYQVEEISFTYERISWTYNIGQGATYSDSWQTPTK